MARLAEDKMTANFQTATRQFFEQMTLNDSDRQEHLALFVRIIRVFYPIFVVTILISGTLTGNWNNVFLAILLAGLASGIIYGFVRVNFYYSTIFMTNVSIFVIVFITASNARPPHVEIAYVLLAPLLASIYLSPFMTGVIGATAAASIMLFGAITTSMPSSIVFDLTGLTIILTIFIVAVGHRRRQFEEARRELRVQQERTKLMEFVLNSISHDLRTPLTVIETNLYLLERDKTPDKRQQRIDKMRHQTKRLDRMVSDILMFSHMEANQALDKSCDLVPIVHQTVASLQELAQERKITLTATCAMTQAIVKGDADLWGTCHHELS
jgi:signal transduction histidine kinase